MHLQELCERIYSLYIRKRQNKTQTLYTKYSRTEETN
jgi:hypothetical protein